MIVDDYIEYTNKYKNIYDKCVVLMQVGSFFELYGIPDKNLGANIDEICEILEIQSTRKNTKIAEINRKNPKMAGIPLYVVNKYIEILNDNGYIVILVEQTTPPPEPKREVTKIISPTVNIENNHIENNFLMCIYFTLGSTKTKDLFLISSISYIDINTNHTYLVEYFENDSKINIEDVLKTVNNIKPQELLIFTDIKTKSNENIMQLLFNFVKILPINICIHNRLNNNINDVFFKLSYQKEVLKKIFKNTGMVSVIEYLELEMKPVMTVSYVYLLQFCYELNEKILEGLTKPVFIENEEYLGLVNNALDNLNIICADNKNKGKTSSLINFLNNCKTSIGKRYFKHCLINPLTNINKIEERYNQIEYFTKNNIYKEVIPYLCKISDLEKLFKKIILQNLQPQQMNLIYNSLLSLQQMFIVLNNNNCDFEKLNWSIESQDKLCILIEYFIDKFNLEEMEKVNLTNINRNLFNKSIYPELDNLENELIYSETIFQNICNSLNEETNTEYKLEINKDNIRSIVVTKNRYQNLLKDQKRVNNVNKLLKNNCNITLDDITCKPFSSNNTTTLKIFFKDMNMYQTQLTDLQNEIKNRTKEFYLEELQYLYENFNELFKNITNFISKVDFYSCNANNAINYCYTKPILTNCSDSYIKAEGLRHPLIEQINIDTPYISNPIEIGTENTKGILLYGLNASGKSSYMKSVGMNLIMAQAGLYTASKYFEFSPYNHVFSRVVGGDNIFKQQSTFVSEIAEIRTILKRSTNKSLILGDELLSSTETTSAISLVAAGINSLSNKKSSFLFASHLHELCNLEEVKKLKNVKTYHLTVDFEKETNRLIYNRILKEGNGDTLYGLEVAKSLDLPSDFLLLANQIRQEYTGNNLNIVNPIKSKYNSNIFIDKCCICGQNTEEIHHIIEQKNANNIGIIENEQIHKNRKSNLINVCGVCHDNIHNQKIDVKGYIQTSDGIKLQTSIKKEQNFSEIQNKVINLRSKGDSYAQILNTINSEYVDSNITLYRIKKWLK
jgi:DNA mismatch repair protein MutS